MKALVMVAAALLLAGTASAQTPESEGEAEPAAPSAPEAIRDLHDFARCIAERRTVPVRRLLAMDYRSAEYGPALRRIVTRTGCPGTGQFRANGRFLAARMAEALIRERMRGASLATLVTHDPSRPALQARDEGELMSLCVVRAAPADVATLFATQPAGEAEAAAIGALAPRIGECLTAGATGRFNRSGLRSMLGLAAYRLAEQGSPSTAQ